MTQWISVKRTIGKDSVERPKARRFLHDPLPLISEPHQQQIRGERKQGVEHLPGLISNNFNLASSGGCKRLFFRQQRAGYV